MTEDTDEDPPDLYMTKQEAEAVGQVLAAYLSRSKSNSVTVTGLISVVSRVRTNDPRLDADLHALAQAGTERG